MKFFLHRCTWYYVFCARGPWAPVAHGLYEQHCTLMAINSNHTYATYIVRTIILLLIYVRVLTLMKRRTTRVYSL